MIGIEDSYRAAEEITRRHAKSFYFSSLVLDRELREACYAIYAFCRCADDAVDCAGVGNEGGFEEKINLYRRYVEALDSANGKADLPNWWIGWAETVRRYGIPKEYFYELLEGLAMDRGRVRIKDQQELDLYCYRVASVVGMMLTHIYVKDPGEDLLGYAARLGRAMQMTNILRDVAEDWERDRLYLPQTDLQAWDIDEKVFAGRVMKENLRKYIKAKVEETREDYRSAEAGIRRLPLNGGRLAVWVMRFVYAEILEKIAERGYDVFKGRAYVGLLRKLILGWKAWKAHRGGEV